MMMMMMMMVQESVESGGPGQDQATQTDDEDIGTDSPRPPRHAPARPARPTSFNCAGQWDERRQMKLELLRLCHAVSVHVSALFPLTGLSSAGLKFFIQKFLI